MSEQNTALAKREEKGLPGLLRHEAAVAKIQPFLPEGVSYERVVAAAQLAAAKNPEILLCTPASIVEAVGRAMQAGLEIGFTAHLVPYNVNVAPKGQPKQWEKRLQFIADYTGLAQLMVESGAVRFVEAHCVYAGDEFEYEQGSDARLRHVPVTDKKSRGALAGAYCILRLPFGQRAFQYMPIEDIDEIRQRHSKSWKEGPCPPWYAKKTVVRQAAKLVPKNPRLARALAQVDAAEAAALSEMALASGEPGSRALPRPASEDDVDRRPTRARTQGAMEDLGAAEGVEVDRARLQLEDDEHFQDDRDLEDGELPLGETRRSRNAQSEGR